MGLVSSYMQEPACQQMYNQSARMRGQHLALARPHVPYLSVNQQKKAAQGLGEVPDTIAHKTIEIICRVGNCHAGRLGGVAGSEG